MKLMSIFLISLSGFLSACSSPRATALHGNTFTIELPKGVRITGIDSDDRPALFEFLLESDYVVIASTNRSTAIGKRVKKAVPDMAEWMVGTVNHFQIEELLFSREQFLSDEPLGMATIRTFETFKKMGNWQETYKANTRFLLFLKEIPKDEEIFSTLELDREKKYYRPYIGPKSIFPDPPDPMHGTNNVGRIDLSTGRYSELVETIRKLCQALSPGSNKERIANLKRLTKSNNEILRENAEYAIRYLRELNQKISRIE